MNSTDNLSSKPQSRFSIPRRGKDEGLYNSITICKPLAETYEFCKNPSNLDKIFIDLPKGIENFFDLTLLGAEKTSPDQYQIKWQNKADNKVKGFLTIDLVSTASDRWTMMMASAMFSNYKSKKEESSDLMYVFLKRVKAMVETGEIASTKGQPSGREELKNSNK